VSLQAVAGVEAGLGVVDATLQSAAVKQEDAPGGEGAKPRRRGRKAAVVDSPQEVAVKQEDVATAADVRTEAVKPKRRARKPVIGDGEAEAAVRQEAVSTAAVRPKRGKKAWAAGGAVAEAGKAEGVSRSEVKPKRLAKKAAVEGEVLASVKAEEGGEAEEAKPKRWRKKGEVDPNAFRECRCHLEFAGLDVLLANYAVFVKAGKTGGRAPWGRAYLGGGGNWPV